VESSAGTGHAGPGCGGRSRTGRRAGLRGNGGMSGWAGMPGSPGGEGGLGPARGAEGGLLLFIFSFLLFFFENMF
jgi:hypothetical protein